MRIQAERMQVRRLALGCNLNQVELMLRNGLVNQRVYDRYWRLWAWSAPRFRGVANALQESRPDYAKRIARVRSALQSVAL